VEVEAESVSIIGGSALRHQVTHDTVDDMSNLDHAYSAVQS
jgi:hypothetical protein